MMRWQRLCWSWSVLAGLLSLSQTPVPQVGEGLVCFPSTCASACAMLGRLDAQTANTSLRLREL